MLSTVNVVDIISSKMALKKSGAGFKGLCPFHHEKTPSFIVSPSKNIYKCFGCGASGSSVSFIMDYEKLSYIEAVEYIAESFHYELETEGGNNSGKFDEYSILYKILEESRDFFINQLNLKRNSLNFYLEKRNLNDDAVKNFSIGFAPESFNALYKHLKSMNFSDNAMIDAGVVTIGKNNKIIDRFINRLMFPIFSERGKTIGFGGRVFSELDASKFGKYINSKESKVYHKSEVLYGLNASKQFINTNKEVIVVEGYLDVIALYEAGIKNIVSASGTAFTDQQIKLLKKYTNKFILCFDGDAAGEKAAERMIEPVIKNDINCNVVALPLNEDPDSYVSKFGKEVFLDYVKNNEVDIIDFFININLKKANSENEILNKILEILSPLEESTTLFFIFKKLSKRFEIPLSTITKSFKVIKNKNTYSNSAIVDSDNRILNKKTGELSSIDKKIKNLERELMLIFLEFPNFLNMEVIYLFENESTKKILNMLLDYNYTNVFINKESFLNSLGSELPLNQLNYLKMLKPKDDLDSSDEDKIKSTLNYYLQKLDISRNKKYIDEIKKEIVNIDNFFKDLEIEDIRTFKKSKKIEISEITQKIRQIENIKNNNYL